MKVFLYTVKVHESPTSLSFEQMRIFIPDKGIFAFHKQKSAGKETIVDFFTDNPEDLKREKKLLDKIMRIEQNETNPDDKFIATTELPDNLMNKTIAIAKQFQKSKKVFETYAKNLFAEAEIDHITINNNQERN